MRRLLLNLLWLFAGVLASGAFGADDQAIVTTFELTDGRTLEAIRFAAAGDEGAKTFMLTTLEGERKTIAEKDIASRRERIVPISELPPTARAQVRAVKKADSDARAASDEDAKAAQIKNQAIAAIVRKEIDARIAFKKINDEWARAGAEQAQYNAEIANLAVAIAGAEAEQQAALAELKSLGEARSRDRKDKDGRQEEALRESRRDSLHKKAKRAAEERARLAERKAGMEKQREEAGAKLKVLTQKKDAAQYEIDGLAAEKSKAIVASLEKKSSEGGKTGSKAGAPTIVKLADGTVIRARSVKAIEGGMLLIVDENGKEQRVKARDVDVGE